MIAWNHCSAISTDQRRHKKFIQEIIVDVPILGFN